MSGNTDGPDGDSTARNAEEGAAENAVGSGSGDAVASGSADAAADGGAGGDSAAATDPRPATGPASSAQPGTAVPAASAKSGSAGPAASAPSGPPAAAEPGGGVPQGTTPPDQGATAPGQGAGLPAQGTTTPAQGTTTPAQGTTPPPQSAGPAVARSAGAGASLPAPPAYAPAGVQPAAAGVPADAAAWQAWQAHQQRQRAAAQAAAPPAWTRKVRPAEAAPVRTATLVAVLVTGLAFALLLGDGMGPGLALAALPAMAAAYAAARAARRRARPCTLAWVAGCGALLLVPALRDSAWPSSLAILSTALLGALALHGSRTWPGVLLSPLGFFDAAVSGLGWAWTGLRSIGGGSKDRWLPVAKAAGVAVVLLLLFGALFSSADAAFADLLGDLTPDVSIVDGPLRIVLFLFGALLALTAARAAAAPLRWDRIEVAPGKPRSRLEWALPLVLLNLLFAGFNAVQLAVLFGGYDKVLKSTHLTYAEYAQQGFWQLLWATLLTLAVIALALRWAPRGGDGDRRFVRVVLGVLCALTLVVVASALRRMDLYVDAYGLTQLRVSVAAMELWLGLVIVLIMAAGVFGARWLPRAVVGSAAGAVLVFGLLSPDGMVAERNVARFQETDKIDLAYFQSLSADAAPALDRLPEPQRSCALRGINDELSRDGRTPWYAMSLGEYRARTILRERPVTATYEVCSRLGTFGSRNEY